LPTSIGYRNIFVGTWKKSSDFSGDGLMGRQPMTFWELLLSAK
jgi:hypothetical protein